jgi:hypothetical protein
MYKEMTEKIYGKFTQKGIVTEVKPSADEEARMMRQMSFLPEGLKNESTVLVDKDKAVGIVLDVRMWIEVRKVGEVWFVESFGYDININNE